MMRTLSSAWITLFAALLLFSSAPTTASAGCSPYLGRAAINELFRQSQGNNNDAFAEVRRLDSTIDAAVYNTWNLRLCNSSGCLSSSISNAAVNLPWMILDGADIPYTYYDIAGGMDALLTDANGDIIDYVSVANWTSDGGGYLAACSYPYDTTANETLVTTFDVRRNPDGIGEWSYGPGNSAGDTSNDTNEGTITTPVALSYSFDEAQWSGSAGEIIENGSSGLNGMAHSGATTAFATPAISGSPGTCGYGIFDGVDNYVTVPYSAYLDATDALTVTAWINPASLPSGSGLESIISKDTNFKFLLTSDGQINWWWRDNTGTERSLTTTLNSSARIGTNNWNHIAIVYSKQSRSQTIYVNGVASASATYRDSLATNHSDLYIGADIDTGSGNLLSDRFFNGFIDEVHYYNYALDQTAVQAVMNQTHPCPSISTLDHFNIAIGSGIASTCTARAITISARDATDTTIPDYSNAINITTSTSHGDWSIVSALGILDNGNADDGTAAYGFVTTDTGSVTLNLENHHADDLTITVTDPATGISSTSASISFRDNAFVITPTSNFGAQANSEIMVAGRTHNFDVSMWRRDPATGDCAIASNYNNNAQGLKAYIDRGGVLTAAADPLMDDTTSTDITIDETVPASNNISLDFSDTTAGGGSASGSASFSLNTSDVGGYTLYLFDDSNGFASATTISGSINLVAIPFGFDIDFSNMRSADYTDGILDGSSSDTSYAADANGTAFTTAGTDFSADLTAVIWQAADDANNDGIPDTAVNLTDNAPVPSFGAEGSNYPVTFSALYVDPPESATNIANDRLSAAALSSGNFTVGTASAAATVNFDNVGIIDLSATMADYLGKTGATVTGTANNLGRFTAASFAVTLGTPDFAPAITTFTYLGQPFTYATPPSLSISALSAKGTLLTNYQGDYWKLGTTLSDATAGFASNFRYSDNVANPASTLSAPTAAINYGDTSAAGGNLLLSTFHVGESFIYSKPVAPLAPFDADISLVVQLQDSDGASGSGTLSNIGFSNDSDSGPFNTTADNLLRFGRSDILDTFEAGITAGTIANVPLQMQYYDGTSFIANSDDTITSVTHSNGTPAFSCSDPATDSLDCGMVTITDATVTSGNTFSFILNADIAPQGGTLVYSLLNSTIPTYLQYDWDGNGTLESTDQASASVTFALPSYYHGDSRFIYSREKSQ